MVRHHEKLRGELMSFEIIVFIRKQFILNLAQKYFLYFIPYDTLRIKFCHIKIRVLGISIKHLENFFIIPLIVIQTLSRLIRDRS